MELLKKQDRSVQFGLEIKKQNKNQPLKPVSWLGELNWSLCGWSKQFCLETKAMLSEMNAQLDWGQVIDFVPWVLKHLVEYDQTI